MIKSIRTMLRESRERYTVPRRVQDVIPVRRIWNDGIFMVGGRFAKTYQFSDINSSVAPGLGDGAMYGPLMFGRHLGCGSAIEVRWTFKMKKFLRASALRHNSAEI